MDFKEYTPFEYHNRIAHPHSLVHHAPHTHPNTPQAQPLLAQELLNLQN